MANNKRPQIVLKVPATATVGEPIPIDPTGSIDPDGQITAFDAGVLGAQLAPVSIVFHAPGEYELFGTVHDQRKKTDTATAIVVVTDDAPPPVTITITPDTLPPMTVGQPVDLQLVAAGGVAPYLFYAALGSALPPGVVLADDGHVSGTPTEAGAYAVEVVACDANADTGAHDYTGTVADAIVVVGSDLTVADFEYLGAYRVTSENAALFTFAYGGIAGRKVNGQTRLFLAIDETNWHGSILEFAVPAVPPSKDVLTAPTIARVRWWGDVYGGRRGTYLDEAGARRAIVDLDAAAAIERDPATAERIRAIVLHVEQWIRDRPTPDPRALVYYEFPRNQSVLAGLLWDDASRRLFWTYYDVYNVSGRPDWGLGASELHDDTPENDPESFTADGPWRFACPTGDGWTAYGPWRGLGLTIRPDTGELVTSGSIMSGNAGSPWGCDGYGGGRLPAPGHAWDRDLPMPTRYLEHYYMAGKISPDGIVSPGVPLRSQRRRIDLPAWEYNGPTNTLQVNINNEHYGYDSWRQVDGSGLAVWLDDVKGKSGAVWIGSLCNGHEWYANPANNFRCPSHQIAAPVTVTGPVSTSNFAAMWIYKLAELGAVARGELADYAPEPEEINLTKTFGLVGSPPSIMGGNNAIAGTYFDRDARLLYLMSPKADFTTPGANAPLIHVLRIGGAS